MTGPQPSEVWLIERQNKIAEVGDPIRIVGHGVRQTQETPDQQDGDYCLSRRPPLDLFVMRSVPDAAG